ncbi:MAG: PDC sensor domain-containing protein [Pseudomonadota bacterium]
MAEPATPGHRDAVGPLKALLAASIGVPLLLFAGAGWLSYGEIHRAAWERLERVADTVREHAIRVIPDPRAGARPHRRPTRDMDWPTIRQSRDLHLFLRQIREGSPQISRVGLIEPDSRLAMIDGIFPMSPTYVPERNYYRMPRPGSDEDLFISDVSAGQSRGYAQFSVARYKPNSAHSSQGGLIFVAVRPEYFVRYYENILGDQAFNVTLIRTDGAILARYPEHRPRTCCRRATR